MAVVVPTIALLLNLMLVLLLLGLKPMPKPMPPGLEMVLLRLLMLWPSLLLMLLLGPLLRPTLLFGGIGNDSNLVGYQGRRWLVGGQEMALS